MAKTESKTITPLERWRGIKLQIDATEKAAQDLEVRAAQARESRLDADAEAIAAGKPSTSTRDAERELEQQLVDARDRLTSLHRAAQALGPPAMGEKCKQVFAELEAIAAEGELAAQTFVEAWGKLEKALVALMKARTSHEAKLKDLAGEHQEVVGAALPAIPRTAQWPIDTGAMIAHVQGNMHVARPGYRPNRLVKIERFRNRV